LPPSRFRISERHCKFKTISFIFKTIHVYFVLKNFHFKQKPIKAGFFQQKHAIFHSQASCREKTAPLLAAFAARQPFGIIHTGRQQAW
jgi:hypothetical protein